MMAAAWRAGLAYFAAVFALGFVMGTVRTLWLAPRFGAVTAVAIELPIMIAASWFACRACVRRFAVPETVADRVLMGALAFALLMLAELAISVLLSQLTPREHFALYSRTEHQLGLAGQVAFALLPLWMRSERR